MLVASGLVAGGLGCWRAGSLAGWLLDFFCSFFCYFFCCFFCYFFFTLMFFDISFSYSCIFVSYMLAGSLDDKSKYLTSSVAIDANQPIYQIGSRKILAGGLLPAN